MALAIRLSSIEGEPERDAGVLPIMTCDLLLGPPGAGESMLARRLTTILPEMTLAEALDTTRLHRVVGRTGRRTAVVTTRPFRAPRSTVADVAWIGGGHILMVGEVSLAHHGIFFGDELF
jgi:magnesium chelatase family protein